MMAYIDRLLSVALLASLTCGNIYAQGFEQRTWGRIPGDKKMHFTAGFLISFTVGGAVHKYPSIGLVAGVAAGAWKEHQDAMDWQNGNRWDTRDFQCTIAGAVVAYGVHKWIKHLENRKQERIEPKRASEMGVNVNPVEYILSVR